MNNFLQFLQKINNMPKKQRLAFINSFVDEKQRQKLIYLIELSKTMNEEELLYRWQK